MTIAGNNPTNLRPLYKQIWLGQTDSVNNLCVFSTPEYGIRAAAKNLRAYGRGGIRSIRQIFHAWAPAGDGANDPARYAEFVSQQTGLAIDAVLNLDSQSVLVALIKASSLQENGFPPDGANWYPDEVFASGVSMAFQ